MINVAVEGESDREAAKAIVRAAGRTVSKIVVAGGKTKLDPKIPKYNLAARHQPWVVFRDSDGKCPVDLRNSLTSTVSSTNHRFSLRIAHTMTEAWLLADRQGFARFFRVRIALVPTDPEAIAHAKQHLLGICSQSSSRALKADIVTPSGKTGPLYVARINEFARSHWDVVSAAEASPSLRRALDAIRSLPPADHSPS